MGREEKPQTTGEHSTESDRSSGPPASKGDDTNDRGAGGGFSDPSASRDNASGVRSSSDQGTTPNATGSSPEGSLQLGSPNGAPTNINLGEVLGHYFTNVGGGFAGGVLIAGLIATGTVTGGFLASAFIAYGLYSLGQSIYGAITGKDPTTGGRLSDQERANLAAGAAGAVVGGGLSAKGWADGQEFRLPFGLGRTGGGRPGRVAPWGNRTGHPNGEYPHYHWAVPDPNRPPSSLRDQGLGNHRPWEGGWGFWRR